MTQPEPQRLGVAAESIAGETRVAATPATVRQLAALGYQVVVESGAGSASSFSDDSYTEAGALIGDPWQADIVLKVNAPSKDEIDRLPEGATLVSLIAPALNPELVDDLARRPITALAMDAVPRISRAQSLDVLSSMANIAGYRAVDGGGARLRPVLHRPGHRGRQGAARQGAGGRRGRGRARRDRRGLQPRRDRAGHRPAARGGRAGALAGRGVPRRRGGAGGEHRRLRQGDLARTTTAGRPRSTPSRPRTSTSSSPPR